jgi:hypothetical protein
MFDTVRADFWTQSLMWSLVTTLVLGPLVIMLSARADEAPAHEPATPEPATADEAEEAPAFVSEEADRMRTLWPDDAEKKETA